MLEIGRALGLTGMSSLVKKDLFERIYDHMFQLEDCATCKGTCKPDEHIFPPNQEKPGETSPSASPNSRNTRQNSFAVGGSPSRLATMADNSNDNPLGGEDGPLFNGQQPEAPTTAVSLAEKVNAGAGTSGTAIDIEAELAKDREVIQAAIDRKNADEEKRRQEELAKARKPEETPAEILARKKKEQRAAMHAVANRKHREDEEAHKRALEAEKAKATKPAPARKSTESSKRKRSSSRHVGFVEDTIYPDTTPDTSPEKLSSDDEDVFSSDDGAGPFTTKGLVKYMSQSFAKALDHHEKKAARRISIHDADIRCVNGVPHGAPASGKMALQTVPNTGMAARLGLAPTPNFVIEGDPNNIDFKKMHKHMQSGSKRQLGQFVQRQVNWPEEFLSNSCPGKGKTEFDKLSFVEFIDGMLAKCMMETPPERMDDVLANKLTFLREVTAMHYTMGIKDILAVTERFLRGWESKNFEWDDWSQIQVFLREAKYQQMCSVLTAGNLNKKNGGGGGANGGGGAAVTPKGGSHVYGIPTEFLRNKKLCIKYNKNECDQAGSHPQTNNESVTLIHKCAGCLKNGVTPEKEHGVRSCPKGPYKVPFRA